MAAQKIYQISVWFALRIKRRSDYEGLVVMRENYGGSSSDGFVAVLW
jgi:hypothetical protein